MDLERALERLRAAAATGDAGAAAQLAVLAGIDLEAWLVPPANARVLSSGPHVALVDGFLPPAICDWLVELSRPHLARAPVLDPETGVLRSDRGRSNEAAVLSAGRSDVVVALVRARISATSGLPLSGFEETQVLHYSPGEEFGLHVDYLDPRLPAYAEDVAKNGQRVLTVLVYLNDDYEGGETLFPALQRGFKGARGGALVFSNITPEGELDRRTAHAGSPPTRGEKWLLSQWIRYKPG